MKLRKKTSLVLISILYLTNIVNAQLIAHWALDEQGGLTVHDSSGNGYHGRIIKAEPPWSR